MLRAALAFIKGDGDTKVSAAVKTDDGRTPPSPPARTRSPPVPIPTSRESHVRGHSLHHQARPPYNRHTAISEDERRLLPDYDIPADATIIPPPILWAYNETPVMKPGASKSFSPMNTLGRSLHQNTYTASSKRPRPVEMLDGQLAFLNTFDSPVIDPPAPKRQKTHQADVIDIEDDNSPPPLQVNYSSHTPGTPLSVTSMSHRSADRGRGFKPSSSFMTTSRLTDPHRKKSRRASTAANGGHRRSSFPMPVQERYRSVQDANAVPVIELGGNNEPLSRTTKTKVPQLRDHIPDECSEDELQVENPHIVSKHFANRNLDDVSRVKKPVQGRAQFGGIVDAAKKPRLLNNLLIPRQSVEMIEDDDELLEDRTPAASVRNVENGSRTHVPTAAMPRKVKVTSEPGWPLLSARSHGVEVRSPDLFLTRCGNTKTFDLVKHHNASERKVYASLDMRKINRVEADEHSQIRLDGGVSQGTKYRFDLEFKDQTDYLIFRNTFAAEAGTKGVICKPSDYMAKIFRSPIESNTNAHPPPVPAVTPRCDVQEETQSTLPRPRHRKLLIDELNPNRKSPELQEIPKTTLKTRASPQPTATPTNRPVRATRNKQPVHSVDLEEIPTREEEPIKYSVAHGLGQKWSKSVQYGSGRHRALVDFDDLLRLDEGEYLNDQLVDFYMIYLFEQAKVPPRSVYFFNSHFYTSLTRPVPGQKGGINYARVARWTAKEDIFDYDYIVVPVCEASHWYLAIICNVSSIARKPAAAGVNLSSPAPIPSTQMANEQKLASAATQNSAAVQQIPDPSEQLPPDASERQPTEDPNLFDEEARRPSAQDVDIVDSDKDIPAETQRDAVTRESSAEATRLGRLTLDDSIPKGILGDVLLSPPSAMKKGKRKSAGGMKKYPPQEPIIIILDSLGLAHPRTVRALKDYILEEGKAKRSMEAIITQNAFYVRGPHIPMQPNYTDCGVYLLGYLQKFLSEPRTFVKSVLAREMDVETDWPNMKAPAIRNAMRDILMKLAEQQGATKKKKKKLALKKETLSEGPKPQTASSAPVTLPADALPPSTTSIAKENMKHAPPTTAKDDEVDPEEEKTRSGSPTQQVSSHVESSATIPPLAPSSTADEELITSPLMASLESDEAPGGQRARLESPIIFETPSDVSQPSVKLTADGEPKTSKRRSSPRVIIPIRSPEKLKRTLDDPKPHDGDETRGSAVEYEPASKESSPKRLKITDGKSTPRLSRSSATARQSPRNADTDTLPEASSPYVTGTRSLQPTPQQSPLARGSSVNPIEINDSQETIGQPSPTAIRPGSPSPAEGVMQSRVRSQSAKSPRPPITKDPRNVEHRGAPSNRIGQNSFAKLEQERRKQRSQQRSQSPERTIASPARVGADERLPNTNRQRRPSVEEVASFPRPRSSAGPGRAFGRPSTQLSAPHRGGVSPTVMHSTAPSRIRSNRDSPEVQDLEEGDLWDTGRKPPLPTRRRRSTIAESPEPELVELREQAGPLHEDEKVFYHFGKSP